MASVWYIGQSNRRVITSDEWNDLGFDEGTTEWFSGNGYSLPQSIFSQAQLDILASGKDFQLTPIDGPRPGATIQPGAGTGLSYSEFTQYIQLYMSAYLQDFPVAVALTQAEYDALTPPGGRPGVLYAITT